MTAFHHLVKRLRKAERELEKQLEGVRAAISSLEFGGGAVPKLGRKTSGKPAAAEAAEVVGQGPPRDLSCPEAALGEAEGRGLALSLPRVRSLGCGPTARTGHHGDVLVESLHVELGHDRP